MDLDSILFKAVKTATKQRELIHKKSDKLIIKSGVKIKSVHPEVRKEMDKEVDNYYLNYSDGTLITIYEAALLKLCILYPYAVHCEKIIFMESIKGAALIILKTGKEDINQTISNKTYIDCDCFMESLDE